ncbi:MAG TPA: bacillithiol biosynthesis cysteine-adding enzyme BshC [Acidobacteriota bacterium]|nr:bacillithiol biosynthesis cysteine-adding enzyme BshC [Acidobacteriota bacterium]
MKSECLRFGQIPGQNPLFVACLEGEESALSFYPSMPLTPEALTFRAERAGRFSRLQRAPLIRALEDFQARIGAGSKVLEQLKRLSRDGTLAVLTGQQVALFGGPSFAVYKAATAVGLARHLEEAGIAAVPVFWLAADDSDFDEVRTTTFLGADGARLDLQLPITKEPDGTMVGALPVGDLQSEFEKLDRNFDQTSFYAEVRAVLQGAYRPERTLREAFGAWLSRLFEDSGLICFDPLAPEVKRELGPFFASAVSQRAEINRRLQERGEAIQAAGYSPQVFVDETESLLFLFEGKRRRKLEFNGKEFVARDLPNLRISESDLLDRVRSHPEQFGPNVLLRPVLQDHLFPTAVTVGGPSEIAYFAQVNAIAPHFDLEVSIVPRNGFTMVDRKSLRYLERYELTVQELLNENPDRLTEKIIRGGPSGRILAELDRARQDLEKRLSVIEQGLQQQDPPLVQMLEGAKGKMLYQLQKVHDRYVFNHREREGHLKRHLDFMKQRLYPDGRLQERTLNFNQFLMEEGPELLQRLQASVQPFCAAHQIVYL